MSSWLQIVSEISVIIAGACALIIIFDIEVSGNYQNMWIMNIVWPITALYSGPLGLWFYLKVGRRSIKGQAHSHQHDNHEHHHSEKPFWQSAAVSATHCGAGCSLGDLTAEWLFLLIPFTLFGYKIFGSWLIDYGFALLFGIAFQYFNIKPMRNLRAGQALIAAVKADFLSLTSWQVGMYGWMAIAVFAIFKHEIPKASFVFWFMMQIAMVIGFFTAYPVNWWLIRVGIKEQM
jgi:Domain of unknown function (DUF4396)